MNRAVTLRSRVVDSRDYLPVLLNGLAAGLTLTHAAAVHRTLESLTPGSGPAVGFVGIYYMAVLLVGVGLLVVTGLYLGLARSDRVGRHASFRVGTVAGAVALLGMGLRSLGSPTGIVCVLCGVAAALAGALWGVAIRQRRVWD